METQPKKPKNIDSPAINAGESMFQGPFFHELIFEFFYQTVVLVFVLGIPSCDFIFYFRVKVTWFEKEHVKVQK